MVTTSIARGPAGAGAVPARVHALDGLRFLAAAGVLAYHYTSRWSPAWGETPEERFGALSHVTAYLALGPELFFVISGYVVLWSAWGRTTAQVVASRVARLFPAYWVAVVLTSLLLLVVWRDGKQISWGQAAVNLTMLQALVGVENVDGVYWTLWTELRFYVLVALLVAVGLTRRRLTGVLVAWPVLGAGADLAGWHALSTVLVGREAPLFAGGMVLSLVAREGWDRRLAGLLGLHVGLALATVVPSQMTSLARNSPAAPDPMLLAVLVAGCFAAVAAATLSPLARTGAAWLGTLGALTYPLYLVHEYWGWWVITHLHPWLPTPVVLAAAVTTSVTLAWAVHRVVEQRANRPMRRWLEERLGALAARRGPVPTEAGGPVPAPVLARVRVLRARGDADEDGSLRRAA